MAKSYNVNHLTRVVLHLRPDPDCYEQVSNAACVTPQLVANFSKVLANRAERVASMMEALAGMGFTFSAKDDTILADSTTVEAFEAKQYLISQGFKDREFQIILEYARKWDML